MRRLTLMPPFRLTGARRMRFKAIWRSTARLCAAWPVRARIWSSPKITSVHRSLHANADAPLDSVGRRLPASW